jgi:hypothetical protein
MVAQETYLEEGEREGSTQIWCSIVCEGVGAATGLMGRRHTNEGKMQLSNYGEVIGNYDLTFQIN